MNYFNRNIKPALILTPAIFLFEFWIFALSSSNLVTSLGIVKMLLWALILSFGIAYSITIFINEIIKQCVFKAT
jgi:hypothetical protein